MRPQPTSREFAIFISILLWQLHALVNVKYIRRSIWVGWLSCDQMLLYWVYFCQISYLFHLIVEADHKSKINHHGVSASPSILATEETCSQKESAPLWFYNFTFCDARTFPKRCHLVFLTFWGLYICLNIWFHLWMLYGWCNNAMVRETRRWHSSPSFSLSPIVPSHSTNSTKPARACFLGDTLKCSQHDLENLRICSDFSSRDSFPIDIVGNLAGGG